MSILQRSVCEKREASRLGWSSIICIFYSHQYNTMFIVHITDIFSKPLPYIQYPFK